MYKHLQIRRTKKKKPVIFLVKKIPLFFKFLAKVIHPGKGRKHKKSRLSRIFKNRQIFAFLEKRERFAFQTVILTGGVLVTQLIWLDFRFHMVIFLSIVSYILTAWSLKEDIKGVEWLHLFILPVLFTASLSLFYFLLPPRWIIRLTTTAIFAVGTYAILLVENIYNVAAERSIQLLRAAQSVGLLLTLTVVFLSANIIYSLKLSYLSNFLLIFGLSFFLALQSLWSINLEEKLSGKLLLYSLIVALGVGELSLALSFWPLENSSYSLFLSATFYAVTGIIQQYFSERLFMNVIREYILVFIFTFALTFLITRWG